MRINKFISENSQYSRRKADELIKEGKVFLNDKIITAMGVQVNPEKDKVRIGETILEPRAEKIYLALNKPAGFISTRNDEMDRKTVMDLAPNIPNLKPVGRLDKDTEGLLLISNDGEFINKLTHPKYECDKTYFVIIDSVLDAETKAKLEKGVMIERKRTSPAEIIILKGTQYETQLKIKIHEGRNRQIRKMFAIVNIPVKYLQRTQIGNIELGTLKKGQFRSLTKKEINDN